MLRRDSRVRWWEIPEDCTEASEVEEVARARLAMAVYDAAPPWVRAETRVRGELPLVRWWNRLNGWQQQLILDMARDDR